MEATLQGPQSSTLPPTLGNMPPEAKRRAMDRMYSRLQAMYGHRWSSMFPDAQCVEDWHEAWTAGLADLSLAQIGDGIAGLLKAHPAFAPTLAEFRECAKPRVEAAHQRYLPPPKVAANVSAHMDRVKAMLGAKPPAHEWWQQANRQTVEILQQSGDPNAPALLAKIEAHNPELFERKQPWWAS